MMLNIHIYDVAEDDAAIALMRGQLFAAEFPNRVGSGQLAIYGVEPSMAVYRTKSGRIVVRGEKGGDQWCG